VRCHFAVTAEGYSSEMATILRAKRNSSQNDLPIATVREEVRMQSVILASALLWRCEEHRGTYSIADPRIKIMIRADALV